MSGRVLSDPERLDWLRLSRSENVGPITFYRLLDRFGSAEAALKAVPDLAKRGGRSQPIKLFAASDAEKEIAALARLGGRFLARGEPDYPKNLAACEDAPPIIALMGHAHLLNRPMVAVVGARNASANARRFARALASDLAKAGCTVVSGLARGIDTAAHEGALATGTAAVIAGGLDVAYPPENAGLQQKISESGALLAEQPIGTQPLARHFPRRNRIIAGLGLATVVVEATLRSGSLITARLAAEYGREVFAVPGWPEDPRAQGPNSLLKQGAGLAENAEDVLTALAAMRRPPLEEPDGADFLGPLFNAPGQGQAFGKDDETILNLARDRIKEAIGFAPVTVDEILRQCQLSASAVQTVLLEMELAGLINRHPGQKISRSQA